MSVWNISLYFQTFILPLIVIIEWDFSSAQVHRGQNLLSDTKHAHNNCWFNLVNRSELIKKICFWRYPHFTALVSKTFNSAGALQEVSWSGDTVLLDWVCCVSSCDSRQIDDDQITLGLLQLMFGNVNWYFLLTHYSKRLKTIYFAGENTSVLIILGTTISHLFVILLNHTLSACCPLNRTPLSIDQCLN